MPDIDYNKEKVKYSEEVQQALMNILSQVEKEDDYTRHKMLREAKQLELYWHQFQYIFWDEAISDFRIPNQAVLDESSSREEVKFIYDIVVNIFKAHGLSIIAALSSDVPGVSFSPQDADKPSDVRAAKQAEKLGKVICKRNKTKLIFYQALFTLYTSHFVAAYNYYKRDKKYGSFEKPKIEKQELQTTPDSYDCPSCPFSTTEVPLAKCPDCGSDLVKTPGKMEMLDAQVGMETVLKGMECIHIRGTLNVKLPVYAGDQASCGYLLEYTDQHYAYLKSIFPEIPEDQIRRGGQDNYERTARLPSTARPYSDGYTTDLLTFKRLWIRSWMFYTQDKEIAEELIKLFPDGVHLDAIEDVFADATPEDLDDRWTITKGDLSRSVAADPLGKGIIPMQDMQNTTMNLLLESLEHSIPSSFADPTILDFDIYSTQEVKPGHVYPTKTPINSMKKLDDYFFTMKTSTVPPEGIQFDKFLENKTQFVAGDFPSIHGGAQTEGSKTLGEYQESRSYALQRLSIPYQFIYFWWADLVYKCVVDYVKNMIDDEIHVMQSTTGKFDNILFLKEDFIEGKFDLLVPESSVELPVTFSQKRSTIQNLLQLNNEFVNSFLFSPENRPTILRYLGLEELGSEDSNQVSKQLLEIEELVHSIPEMGSEISTVPVEPEIDDHAVHIRVIRSFASSDLGQQYKKENPEGYRNMLLHAREHQIVEMEMMQMQSGAGQPQEKSPEEKDENNNPAGKKKTEIKVEEPTNA